MGPLTVLQAYHGGLQHVREPKQRHHLVGLVAKKAAEVVGAIRGAGLECETVTGAGSGSYRVEAGSGVYTEIQPGVLHCPCGGPREAGMYQWRMYVHIEQNPLVPSPAFA